MSRHVPFEFSLRDVYRVIFRHQRNALAVFLCVMALVVGYIAIAPRSYHSEAKLFVRLGRENTSLDATATIGQSPIISIPQSRENELNTVVEMLTSRVLADRVIDRLGLDFFLGQEGARQPSARESAITHLTQRLSVEPVKKSDVLLIWYRAEDPRVAQKVVSTLTDLYLSEHARLYRTPGTLEFLETETNRVRDELARNEEQLRDLRKNTGLASTETQRTVLVERIAKLEEELLTTEASLASGTAEARLLRESFDGLDKIQVTGNGSTLASTAADDVRRQLYNLQLREQQLLSRYTENHVEVIEVRREIAGAQALLRRQDAPAESAQESLVRREPILQALRSKAGAVQGQLDAARVELASFSENEYTIAKLQREIDLLDANYRKYSDNLEQARIDHSLESRRMSNINVVQPASFNPRPDSPQKALLLVFGLAFAVASSVGVSALRELLDHSLKTPEEIERKLDLPTLVAIPRISEGSFILSGRN